MANSLIPSYYKITINSAGLIGTSADSGFIDHVYLHQYYYLSSFPTNLDLAREKVRANLRYDFLLEELSENQVITLVLNQNNGNATVNSPGSAFSMTIVYDREDYVYTKNELYGVSGHPTEFDEYLYGVDAIKRQCARLWVNERKTQKRMPLSVSSYGWIDEEILVKSPLIGTVEDIIDTAETNITVVKIPDTY
ncbi:MAG: hypothetical protein NZZ41_02990 [Candidatus Dojkabacteria bacterium]|nr:hypothetical protein [Candidatus Dojkabacteria bacterium]